MQSAICIGEPHREDPLFLMTLIYDALKSLSASRIALTCRGVATAFENSLLIGAPKLLSGPIDWTRLIGFGFDQSLKLAFLIRNIFCDLSEITFDRICRRILEYLCVNF